MQLRGPESFATACLFALWGWGSAPAVAQDTPPPPRIVGVLGNALDAAEGGDLDSARALVAPLGAVADSFGDMGIPARAARPAPTPMRAFLKAHAHWPLADHLQRLAEAELADADVDSAQVRAFFETRRPLTEEGRLALAFALREADPDRAKELARALWSDAPMSAEDEGPSAFGIRFAAGAVAWRPRGRRCYGPARERPPRAPSRGWMPTDRLWRAHGSRFRRGNRGLMRWSRRCQNGCAMTPALLMTAFDFRYDQVSGESAADLMLQQSRAPEGLGRPQAWAARRIALVRAAMSDEDYERAYDLATPHGLEDGIAFVDLAFLAGFLALEHLDDPKTGAGAFPGLAGARVQSDLAGARGLLGRPRA